MKLLIAAVLICAVMAPAMAYSQGASITAEDDRWVSSDGGTNLTVPTGTTVEFSYPTGGTSHTLKWTSDKKGSCKGVPAENDYPGGFAPWAGTCTLAAAGTYEFRCGIHAYMTGTIKVVDPTPSATPTPSASPSPSATPDSGATTTPGTTQPPPDQNQNQNRTTPVTTPPSIKLAAKQKGTRVRGTVTNAKGRIEVTVKLNQRRVGRVTKTATGTTTFSVMLDAKARKELKRKRSLKLSVTIAVANRTERHTVRLTST